MFAKNVRYLRTSRGWTQKDVADRLGYQSSQVVNKWEVGASKPRYKQLLELCRIFDVTEHEISNVDLQNRDAIMSKQKMPTERRAVRIKVLGSIPAGIPLEMIEDVQGYEDIPQEMTSGNREYFALRVKGDSMIPDYKDGDVVIVLCQPDCENGQDAVVAVNGNEATLKRVYKKENGILLQPLNPSYEPMSYSNDGTEPTVKVLGVVKELRRSV
jgi:repressor LexA